MKRFHVHMAVDDLQKNIRFYSSVFGQPPTVVKPDYVKWMLDDPRINFAISTHGDMPGVNHLGIQLDSADELQAMQAQLQQAGEMIEEKSVTCCYAESDKYWVTDPQGVAWETYHTLGTAEVFSGSANAMDPSQAISSSVACCGPATAVRGAEPAAGACCGPATNESEAGQPTCCMPAAEAQSAACCGPAVKSARAACCSPVKAPA